jgi:hypothetical protein
MLLSVAAYRTLQQLHSAAISLKPTYKPFIFFYSYSMSREELK